MKIAKTLLVMTVLSVACLAQARKGDVTVQTFTKKTGKSIVTEIGDCVLQNTMDPTSGRMLTSVHLPYAICEEVRIYDADVTDNGWFSKNTISNPRNVRMDVTTRVTSYADTDTPQVMVGTGNGGAMDTNAILNKSLNTTNLLLGCMAEKKQLELQTRSNLAALGAACGVR